MVDLLASRQAGYRLGGIVFTFLVPLIVLGLLVSEQMRDQIRIIERQQFGLRLLSLTADVVWQRQQNQAGDDTITVFLTDARPLAQLLGVAEQYEVLSARMADGKVLPLQVQEASKLMRVVGMKSGLTRNFGNEADFLASAISEDLPQTVSQVQSLIAGAETSPIQTDQAVRQAEISVLLQRLNDNLAAASGIVQSNAELAAYLQVITNISAITKSAGLSSQTNVYAPNAASELSVLWIAGRDQLARALAMSHAANTRKLLVTYAAMLIATILGVASAIMMFRSTLRRLDDIETARRDADGARIKSDMTNERLSEINSDIVKLNQELADKMRRLRDAQEELVKKGRMEQLGQLTATIAHELRNPLGAVRTSAFLLERKVKDKGLGVESQLLRINNGISRCDSIITQLLDFSRTRQISASSIDLDSWLERMVDEEARRLSSQVSIECNLGLDGQQVEIDPARLQRAIINLLNNASEAMVGMGDDPTKATVADPKIKIETRRSGRIIEISVADNGPGIPTELLNKIREPMYTTKSFGTGLGIPAIEQIAIQHGGSLEIQSEVGVGACFTIQLPILQPKAEAA